MQASITSAPFGTLPDGRQVTLYTLTNSNGLVVKVSDFGGVITEIHVPDRDGQFADIALGYHELAPYYGDSPYFGALIGRYGNRIAEGKFEIDGKPYQLSINNQTNHLHGGKSGFDRKLWRAVPFQEGDSVGLTLMHRSPDGDEGYPGNLDVTVVYELNGKNEFIMAFDAVTDQATPINLTQHAYFNLAGQGDILGHELQINADAYTPVSDKLIPTGELRPVEGTAFDFRTPRAIGERIGIDDDQLRFGQGYDHNFVLTRPQGRDSILAARVVEPKSGRVLELWTEEPGVQFYSGNFLDGSNVGKGQAYAFRSGLCLEPQHFPNSPNTPNFPNAILRPGESYATVSRYRFAVEK
ncbi:MAG: aldose epimerase family protein [Gammaproteobacteria bacterium]